MICWIVTGQRGAGKTLFCQAIDSKLQQEGVDVSGILSPGRFDNGVKTGINAQDIRSGERRQLAALERSSASDLAFGHWFFDLPTLEWGNQVLAKSVPCEVLIIDELGPLEFRLSSGWLKAFEVLQSKSYRLAMVVIRPELVEQASEIFSPARTIQVNSPDDIPALVAQTIDDIKKVIRPNQEGG